MRQGPAMSGEGRPWRSPARVGEEEPGAFALAVERRRLGRGGVRQGAAMAESDEGAARRRRLGSSTAAGSGGGRPQRGPARGSHGGVGRGAEYCEGAAVAKSGEGRRAGGGWGSSAAVVSGEGRLRWGSGEGRPRRILARGGETESGEAVALLLRFF